MGGVAPTLRYLIVDNSSKHRVVDKKPVLQQFRVLRLNVPPTADMAARANAAAAAAAALTAD